VFAEDESGHARVIGALQGRVGKMAAETVGGRLAGEPASRGRALLLAAAVGGAAAFLSYRALRSRPEKNDTG